MAKSYNPKAPKHRALAPKATPDIEIALAVIETPIGYALQRRGLDAKIGAAGLLGCIGGKRKQGEPYLDTVVRETREETDLTPERTDFEKIGKVIVPSDMKGKPVIVTGHVYRYHTDRTDIQDLDGQGIEYYSWSQVAERQDELTPATYEIFMSVIEESERI